MASTQMNVRIDEDVKSLGDAAFAKVGLTPSRVVQTVWRLAAIDDALPRVLAGKASLSHLATGEKHEVQAPSEEALEGPRIVESFYKQMGIPLPSEKEKLDYEAMREDARLERFAEKGVAL
ncbi:MAG: type II toxin-antitoxin system RelB/DinJ family antitoxin [Eggerthellaceae bacterium]|nr:type II toxin-antitoxin system RelB/DinJ family antitoxin [Eggerthellaceae bacterium]